MEIDRVLIETPSLKSRASEEAEELRYKWQLAKEAYNNFEARTVLVLKIEEPAVKASEIKFYVNDHKELHEARLKVVLAESNYRKKEVEVKALDDKFTSSKVLARLKMSEMQTIEYNK